MDPSFPDSSSESRIYSPFPPLSQGLHPSLRSHRRSQSISSSPLDDTVLRRPRRSATPYGSGAQPRTKRSRPEPFQLDALKQLYEHTTTPSIEERTALAQKIGMYVHLEIHSLLGLNSLQGCRKSYQLVSQQSSD